MKPLEPLLPGETRSEYLARVDRKPVAWRCRWKDEPDWKYGEKPCARNDLARTMPGFEEQPLYLSPASSQNRGAQ